MPKLCAIPQLVSAPNLLELLYGLYNSLRVSRETFIKRKHLPVGQLLNHIDLREVLFTRRTLLCTENCFGNFLVESRTRWSPN